MALRLKAFNRNPDGSNQHEQSTTVDYEHAVPLDDLKTIDDYPEYKDHTHDASSVNRGLENLKSTIIGENAEHLPR